MIQELQNKTQKHDQLTCVSLQVPERSSAENTQQLPDPNRPSSRAAMQPAAPPRPGSVLSQFMHMGAAQSMLAVRYIATTLVGLFWP